MTSVVALLLAGPAMAQAPASDSSAPAGKGPEIIVKQPPPVITVQPHAPNVTVAPGKPDVSVQQAPPKVDVMNPKPDVAVDTGKPDVTVLPAEKPDVAVKGQIGDAAVGSGTTTAPASGPVTVAPTAGVFPMTDDAKSLMGKDVYGANGKKVGEISNLLVGTDNRVHAAVVEFGGFLGIGEHKVAVPWDQLNVTKDRVTANMTGDQIKAAPHWDKDRPGQFAEYHPYK
jgi:sporulation protein YlmC with PRC-barrel domain